MLTSVSTHMLDARIEGRLDGERSRKRGERNRNSDTDEAKRSREDEKFWKLRLGRQACSATIPLSCSTALASLGSGRLTSGSSSSQPVGAKGIPFSGIQSKTEA